MFKPNISDGFLIATNLTRAYYVIASAVERMKCPSWAAHKLIFYTFISYLFEVVMEHSDFINGKDPVTCRFPLITIDRVSAANRKDLNFSESFIAFQGHSSNLKIINIEPLHTSIKTLRPDQLRVEIINRKFGNLVGQTDFSDDVCLSDMWMQLFRAKGYDTEYVKLIYYLMKHLNYIRRLGKPYFDALRHYDGAVTSHKVFEQCVLAAATDYQLNIYCPIVERNKSLYWRNVDIMSHTHMPTSSPPVLSDQELYQNYFGAIHNHYVGVLFK